MAPTQPSAEDQLAFLRRFQRILDDGGFVTTYKYALLHALADLAVTVGDDSGAPLTLTTRTIAERVLELYWRQAAPFPLPGDRGSALLLQNTGSRQAEILRHLDEAQRRHGLSLARLRQDDGSWRELAGRVDAVVRKMPLWKLQTVGGERDDFLYENVGAGTTITLRPGVAFCLRAFHGMLIELVRAAWLRFVRRYNLTPLDEAADLTAFLFGSPRASLEQHRAALRTVEGGRCFYCHGRLAGPTDVDHFVPWARYGLDLGHNLVLAHAGCNRSKGDHLAARRHLEAWVARNDRLGDALASAFEDVGVAHNLAASTRVAAWAYGQVEARHGRVWVADRQLEPLSADWRSLLAA